MTTERTPIHRHSRNRITPEAVEAFRANDWSRLHRAVGLKPWEASPLRVDGNGPWPEDGTMWTASLLQAAALRKQLKEQV